MLMRGDDGSLIVFMPWRAECPPWVRDLLTVTHYHTDGRTVRYRPEPLRLPPPEQTDDENRS